MRVILLSGDESCGKTTSLKMLVDSIARTGVEILETEPLDTRDYDFAYRMQYPDGKKLVIATQGDYVRRFKEYFEKYKDSCDILVCACNRRFMWSKMNPFVMVTDYDPLTTIVLKKKYKSVTEEEKKVCAEANEACAEYLFALVELIRKQIK